jgi:hypothetical protein
MTIGTVTDGATASATITGTAPNFVLNLVLPNPSISHVTSFQTNPSSVTVEDGDAVTLTASAQSTDTPITYKWQYKSLDWTDIAGAGLPTYSFTASLAQTGRQYRCVAQTPSGAGATSLIAVVTVTAKAPADGSAWDALDEVVTGRVSFANDKFIAQVKYSVDGLNWLPLSPAIAHNRQVLYGNGFYFNGTEKSVDGILWTGVSNPASSANGRQGSFSGIAFNGTVFLLKYFSPRWYYTPPTGGEWREQHTEYFTTSDGLHFTPVTISGFTDNTAQSGELAGLQYIYGQGKFVGKTGGDVYSSVNGSAWTKSASGLPDSGLLFYSGSVATAKYLVLPPGNKVWTSIDAVTWTQRTLPTSADWSDITFGNGMYLAVATNNSRACITSTDGLTWTLRNTLPEAGNWDSVAYGAGKFVAHKPTAKYIAISG